jgi:dephospho-CoA kinase
MTNTSNKARTDCLAIGLIGRIASGKSTLAKWLESTLKEVYRVRFSDTLRSIAIDEGLPDDQETLQSIWARERDVHGHDDFLAKITFMHLDYIFDELNPKTLVIEGIRMKHDITEFLQFAKTRSLPTILVYVNAEQKDRFKWFNERLLENNSFSRPIDRFHFNRIDNDECEEQIEGLIGDCDVILENSSAISLDTFLNKGVEEILYTYGIKDFKH